MLLSCFEDKERGKYYKGRSEKRSLERAKMADSGKRRSASLIHLRIDQSSLVVGVFFYSRLPSPSSSLFNGIVGDMPIPETFLPTARLASYRLFMSAG